ncbi:MAG: endonuclease domain-containing protein [Candidatus Binatia bacterium]
MHQEKQWRQAGIDVATVPQERAPFCAICGGTHRICLDHDHKTGAFRGWLCNACNRALGMLKDDPAILRRAADYIESAKVP